MNETFSGVFGVALIVALGQMLKSVGIDSRYMPVVTLVLGLVLNVAYRASTGVVVGTWFDAVVQGLALGLSASGLYSGGQTLVNGPTILRENATKELDIVIAPKGSLESAFTNSPAVEAVPGPESTLRDEDGAVIREMKDI